MSISRWLKPIIIAFLALQSLGGAGAQGLVDAMAPAVGKRVTFAGADLPVGASVTLQAWWYPAPGHAAGQTAPAVVLLHGCGGMFSRQGEPSMRMRSYTELLNGKGWHALVVDSLTPRGEKELCTQRSGTRKVTMVERRRDALAALQWLAVQPEVDAARLALLGWSNGGSAVLAATNRLHPEVARAAVKPVLAVAFYPGCDNELRRGYQPVSDTLLLVGLADDWTPAAPCQALAGPRDGPNGAVMQVRVLAYEDAHHGFDGLAPVMHRKDVPNGVNPGQGVHVGGNAEARRQSRQALLDALQAAFARP